MENTVNKKITSPNVNKKYIYIWFNKQNYSALEHRHYKEYITYKRKHIKTIHNRLIISAHLSTIMRLSNL